MSTSVCPCSGKPSLISDSTGSLPDLPYLDAVFREVFRWNNIGPTAIPHLLSQDDEYAGYRLEKGSMVIVNLWAMGNEEAMYPNPMEFNPDRYFPEDSSQTPVDPRSFMFSFGRR